MNTRSSKFELKHAKTGQVLADTDCILEARELERQFVAFGSPCEIWRGNVQLTMRPLHSVSFAGTKSEGFGSLDSILIGTAL